MRTRKALLNMSFSLVYQLVAIICGLITPRLILQAFGSTYNGVVASATQFLGIINILTLGITASTRVALYKTLSNKETLGTSRLMKAMHKYMHKVAMWLIVYSIVLCIIYPYISHSSLTYGQSALLIAIISIGTFAEYFFGISNMTLLQADQSNYITSITNIFKIVINTICVFVLIKMGSSIYIVKLGSSIIFFIMPFLLSLYIRKKYTLISDCKPDNTAIKQRKAVAFHSISNIIHSNVDIFVLTLFVNATIISVYSVYYLVVGKIRSLMEVCTSGIEAALGDMWVKKEYTLLKETFSAFEYIIFSFAAVVFACVATLIVPFVALYTKNIVDVNYIRPVFAALVTITEAMYCLREPYITLVYATGNFEKTKIGAALEAGINIILSIILVNIYGINGVIIATLCANLFRTIQFAHFISKYVLDRSIKLVYIRFVWLLITTGISIAFIKLSFSVLNFESGWFGWICKGCLATAIALLVTLFTSILKYKDDLSFIIEKLSKAIKHCRV